MADTSNFPVSYKDPLYASLDQATEQKLGLPSGLLSSIRVNGEKSNADQVSSAGAKTPWQITPATRAAAIKSYGIDPYLSPQNASEVAGNLLADSLKRNGNDPAIAVSEYHGGTNPQNWGPITKAYVQRVMAPLSAAQAPAGAAGAPAGFDPNAAAAGAAPAGPSTFDRVSAQMQAAKQAQAPSQIASIYQAYQSGQMAPDEAAQFEADVRSGKMMLPQGASLSSASAPGAGGATSAPSAAQVPAGVMQAFANGQMTPHEMTQFEQDVRSGAMQLPQGMDADALFGAPEAPKGVLERIAAVPGAIREAITGAQRATPTTDALPDYDHMPEFGHVSMAALKSALGTMFSSPDQTAKVIQANFPGVQVSQDEKGNYLLRSAEDGQTYAIKPGFQPGDIPRALGAIAAFTPAGRATSVAGGALAAGGTQAAIEGAKYATGGDFSLGDVAGAAALGGAAPVVSRVLSAAAGAVKNAAARVLGTADSAAPGAAGVTDAAAGAAPMARPVETPTAGASGASPQPRGPITVDAAGNAAVPPGGAGADAQAAAARAAAGAPAAPAATAAATPGADTIQSVAQTAAKAAGGSKSATQTLASMAAPNPETLAAAERLGVGNFVQADHMTANEGFRQTAAILKSMSPVSDLSLSEREGLANVARRASGLIDEIGGTSDLSALDSTAKSRMQATHAELGAREDALYSKLRSQIPATADAPATNTLDFIAQRAKALGGADNLTTVEKTILQKLTPTPGADSATLEGLAPQARAQAIAQGADAGSQPTYALIDDIRKAVGRKIPDQAFSDQGIGLNKQLYGLLTQDQGAAAQAYGAGGLWNAAKAATTTRIGMENNLQTLFGKALDKSLVPGLGKAMSDSAKGDASNLVKLLQATPESMRQELVTSGLQTVLKTAQQEGRMDFTNFANWYGQLKGNSQAFNAVMANIPASARQQINDLYLVSKGIGDSLKARIATGRLNTVVQEAIQAPDTLAAKLYDLAKHAGKGLAVDAVGGHGAGILTAIMSATSKGKTTALKAIDELLTSPEFVNLARNAGTPGEATAVKRMAFSPAFSKVAQTLGQPQELSNREQWILRAMQARNSAGEAGQEGKLRPGASSDPAAKRGVAQRLPAMQ
ncbi:MAG: hypothetical protein KGN16_06020 [Burkholderiales bacterium]|nr:hypothetical protein [Burkholderiales bacterium]